jgi:hypothetical protein
MGGKNSTALFSAIRVSDEWRAAYVYVPKDRLASIRTHGLLSVRRLYELTGEIDMDKYKSQFRAALDKYGDEMTNSPAFAKARDSKLKSKRKQLQILAYLDWRSDLPNGSSAIYFLHAPVPRDQRRAIKKQRGWDLNDMVLLQTYYNPRSVPTESINGKADEHSDWTVLWRDSLVEHAGNEPVLWLEGIPHAMFVPPQGMIPFEFFNVL